MKRPISTLVLGDARSIVRDSTMILAAFGPLAIFALLFFLPFIESLVFLRFAFNLEEYRLFIVGFLSLIPSMLFGMIFGFVMLDERDEDIISFISVTPLQKKGYLSYKLQVPMALSAVFFLLLIYATRLIELNPLHAPFIAILVALESAIGALFLVAYSENKVEGLAFSKLMGIMYLAVPAVFLWPSNWHWITAVVPPFWIAKAYLHSEQGSFLIWLDLGFGLLIHLAVILLLIRVFFKQQE